MADNGCFCRLGDYVSVTMILTCGAVTLISLHKSVATWHPCLSDRPCSDPVSRLYRSDIIIDVKLVSMVRLAVASIQYSILLP